MEINYLAVLVAGIASMIVGFLWYGPLFGKTWMALSGITPEAMGGAKKKSMALTYLMSFIGSLMMSAVFAWIFSSIGEANAGAGMAGGFWLWLGFIVPVMLGKVLWEGKPWKLYFLDTGYYLVNLLIIGAIIGGWQ